MGHLRRSFTLAAASLLVAATLTVGVASPAQAAPFNLDFLHVTGSTHLAKPDVTAQIPESVVNTVIDLEAGTVTGQVRIPDFTVNMDLGSLIGVTSTVRLVPAGPLTGTITPNLSNLSTTATFTIQLVDVHLDALPGVNLVPSTCRTKRPTAATLVNTTPVDIFQPITMEGTYTIPHFTRCGLLTPLLNLLLSGPNNTMTLILK